jgi:hypothetical protein
MRISENTFGKRFFRQQKDLVQIIKLSEADTKSF